MKGLEALERIKNAPTIYCGCASDIYTRYSFECKAIEKELKALEIIKDKEVDITYFVHYANTYNDYFIYAMRRGLGISPLTKEEFDLLQEVLL